MLSRDVDSGGREGRHDHAHARRFAEGLGEIPGAKLVREPETNIVLFRVPDPDAFVSGTRERGLRINPIGPGVLRAVFHLDVSAHDVERALEVIGLVLR